MFIKLRYLVERPLNSENKQEHLSHDNHRKGKQKDVNVKFGLMSVSALPEWKRY